MRESIEDAQRRLARELMPREDVAAVAVGAEGGAPCLKVYLSGPGTSRRAASGDARLRIPDRYEGHPVKTVAGGPFRACRFACARL